MDTVVEHPGALDVHKKSVTAAVRVPAAERTREDHVAHFQTTVQGLLALRDWLEAHGVEQVAMEATGVYWKPVWAVLEGPLRAHALQRPARQAGAGPKDRRLRRPVALPAARGRAASAEPRPAEADPHAQEPDPIPQDPDPRPPSEANRLHKILEDTGIKLDCVATDLLGKSGRAMLDALVCGTTDPEVLADLVRGRLRQKLPALREALCGRFESEHALVVGQILAHIDYLDEAIERLSEAIEEELGPLEAQVELLCTIPGAGRRTAEVIIAETGGDMSAFASPKHLASWAGVCPGNDESAGKRRSGRTRRGSKWLRSALTEAAHAAARTRDTYLAAQYHRLRIRRGSGRAAIAVSHSMLVATWHMLQTGELYVEPGGDFFARRDPERTKRRLVAQLERLGHTVILQEAAA